MPPQLLLYGFEIYTCHPQTGEMGWDILNISIPAFSLRGAKKILKTVPHFDIIILVNYHDVPLKGKDLELFTQGLTWWLVDYDYEPLEIQPHAPKK